MTPVSFGPDLDRLWAPPTHTSVVEWAEQNVVLPSVESNSLPGPFRIARSPCIRDPLNAFGDRSVSQITIMSSTQVAKSTAEILMVLYTIHQSPRRIVWVMARELDVKGMVSERLRPILEASPEFADMMRGSDRLAWAKGDVTIGGCPIKVAWSFSDAAVQSWPAGVVIMDELSSWRLRIGGANPIKSAKQRTIAQTDPKIVCVSTPKSMDDMIVGEFEKSDGRECYVPCPHCARYQTLVFNADRLRWPKTERDPERMKALKLAKYFCAHCEKEITESQRRTVCVPNHVWAPRGCTVEDGRVVGDIPETTHRGYHFSSFYSLFPLISFSRIAAEFLEANGYGENSKKDIKSFYNYWLGMPYEESEEPASARSFEEMDSGCDAGVVPTWARVLTAAMDMGKEVIHWGVRAWGYGNRSALVACGTAGNYEQIEAHVLAREWADASGVRRTVRAALMDSGWNTDKVIDFCRRYQGRVFPCKGRSPMNGLIDVRIPNRKGQRFSKVSDAGLSLVNVNVDYYKAKIATLIEGKGSANSETWLVHRHPRKDYCAHLVAERRVNEQQKDGSIKKRWKAYGPNHFLDMEVYLLASAEMLGLPYELHGEEVDRAKAFVSRTKEDDYSDWSADVVGEW